MKLYIRWFLIIMKAQSSDDSGKVDNVFLKAYRDCGLAPPDDAGEIFLVFPVPREKLQSALELARVAIVLKLDQVVDKVLENSLSEELLLSQMT